MDRCKAIPEDLDGDDDGRRTCEWTDELISTLSSRVLWDEFGIDDDVVVSLYLLKCSAKLPTYNTKIQPFTNDFPRADIHEMLSPDILHQLIKGTFKDHLVEWVCEYLTLSEGEARANEILDEIDRRCVYYLLCIF
jgi:hypothetical protein